jgi:membrane dipeptidase
MRFRILLVLLAPMACAQAPAADIEPTPVSSTTSASPAPKMIPMSDMQGVSERAMRIYREAIVIDTHNDLPTQIIDEGYDPSFRHPAGSNAPKEGHTDIPRLAESGIDAVFWSAFIGAEYANVTPNRSYQRVVIYLDTIDAMIKRYPDVLMRAESAADLRRAVAAKKVASFIGVEGGHAIENSLDKLRELHRRGARYMTLTWNNGNEWAGANAGTNGTSTGGLTPFGKEVIREMNRLGILVDISHVSDQTFYDAVAASTMPVIASHSSSRAVNLHRRNMTDDMLRAVAKNGGVVNVNFAAQFIDSVYRIATDNVDRTIFALRDSLRRSGADSATVRRETSSRRAAMMAKIAPARFSVLIDHFDHIAKVAGIDHVGIGSDYDGVGALPEYMEDVTKLPLIAQALLDRGYSEEDVKKVLGGNMLRVIEQAIDRNPNKR